MKKALIRLPDHKKVLIDTWCTCDSILKSYHEWQFILESAQSSEMTHLFTHRPELQLLSPKELRIDPWVSTDWDLIVNLNPYMDKETPHPRTQHLCGFTFDSPAQVNGRWSQLFVSQMASSHFSPFTPRDILTKVIAGADIIHEKTQSKPPQSVFIDLNGASETQKIWLTELAQRLSLKKNVTLSPPKEACTYLGANPLHASWYSFLGSDILLLAESPWNPLWTPWSGQGHVLFDFTIQTLTQTEKHILELQELPSRSFSKFQNTDSSLTWIDFDKNQMNSHDVFQRLMLVMFSYINDLKEIDLPIPRIDSSTCLRLKAIQSLLKKLEHLNEFGIKYINDFLTIAEDQVTEEGLKIFIQQMKEIDDLTQTSLQTAPELEALTYWLKLRNAQTPGNHFFEVAKQTILNFHESNQIYLSLSELIEHVTKNHFSQLPISNL
jgi:hypothetical protein